jgi:hypothetical protein
MARPFHTIPFIALAVLDLFLGPVAALPTEAQQRDRSLIYELLEQRQSRGQSHDPAQHEPIERLPERPALPDTMRDPETQRDPILRPGVPDPARPRSPLLDSDRRQQEDRAFQERLDRRERFERQRLLMER